MIEYLRFAWTAFKANKIRFFLTTLGVFIGVTTIIIIFTIIQSINEYIADEVAAFGTTTIYIDKFPWVITENYFEYRNRPPITLKEYEALDRNVTYTHWISPIAGYRRNVKYRNERLERVLVTGCNERYPETNNVVADIGRWFTASEVRSARLVCVIGRNIWDELFRKQDAVGKRLKINGYPYRVIGIMEKKGNLFGFNMDNQIIVPYTAMRGYAYTWRGISIAMKVDRPAKLEGLKHEAQGILRRVRKVSPQEEDNFAINQQNMLTDFYNQITGTAYIVIFLIGAVSLVVGGIGIMNIMLVSVTERTREIGIRKAVGATRKRILLHFLTESVAISSIGGMLGVVAGVLLSEIPLNLMNLDTSVSIWTVIIGYGFSAFVGIVSGMYPAHKAAKMHPIESLRYE